MVPPPPESTLMSADAPDIYTCMQPMHEPHSSLPIMMPQRPQISCGVGRCCDAETAVTGMLRRLVRRYEGVLPCGRVCGLLRGFVEMLQRLASGNAAATPQEQYPPAVHVISPRGGAGVAVTVEPQFVAAMEMWGDELRDVVAGASAALACVFGALVCTTLQILAALERQPEVRTHPDSCQMSEVMREWCNWNGHAYGG